MLDFGGHRLHAAAGMLQPAIELGDVRQRQLDSDVSDSGHGK